MRSKNYKRPVVVRAYMPLSRKAENAPLERKAILLGLVPPLFSPATAVCGCVVVALGIEKDTPVTSNESHLPRP